MSKKCKSCGSDVPNDANFCQVCGGADFVANNQTPNQPVFDQTWQPPVPQDQPKKKKTGLVIGIIAAVLVVLAGVGMLAEKVSIQEQDEFDAGYDLGHDFDIHSDTNYNPEEASEKLYYSKGTFDGSVYVNNWADIKFELPQGYSNADLATYNAAEDSNTECGIYFWADDAMGMIYICYEKLPAFPVYNEGKYLDAALKALQNISGVTYKIPDTYTTANIAGQTYTKAECAFNNGNGDFANTFYVRKLDGYMIVISAIGASSEANDALVGCITNAK